jgi:hypothetical protein
MMRNRMRHTIALLALALPCAGALHSQESARPPAASLLRPGGASQAVDARGFIRRWLVLEPGTVPGQLTQAAVESALQAAALPGPATAVPKDGDVVQRNPPLRWHAVESKLYNLNLYHFAWALTRPTSNVLFWTVTTVEAPQQLRDVRLAICSNAASRWWLNGEQVISIYGDRQSVIDDGVSKRLTLRKGRNVIRGAIVNGGGATDFCARFLDARDRPVTGLRVSLQPD